MRTLISVLNTLAIKAKAEARIKKLQSTGPILTSFHLCPRNASACMGSQFMEVLQLFLSWAILDACLASSI